jgi:outer membrane protein TolC
VLAASDAQLAADQVQLFLALGGGWENTHAKHGEEHAGRVGGSAVHASNQP